MTVTRCETVTIVVISNAVPGTGHGVRLELPAFTRDPEAFMDHIADHLARYIVRSGQEGTEPSTADFLLYLAVVAFTEPSFQATATDVPEATDAGNGGAP